MTSIMATEWSRLFRNKTKTKAVNETIGQVKCDPGTSKPNSVPSREQSEPKPWKRSARLRRQLSGQLNSLGLIKIRLLVLVMLGFASAEAGFFSFYFPNVFKPKGFDELTEMITSLQDQINSTIDNFSDRQYFWGLLQKLDETPIENNYPEISACKEIFPVFRDLAIEYVYIDFDYFVTPLEEHLEFLVTFRDDWYPAQHESTAKLPREWEQKLLETELQAKINKMEELTNKKELKEKRQKLVDIWKNVRRSLDDSVECLYLRYAYRNIAEDINQLALEMNLRSLRHAMTILTKAYARIAKYKESDEKIIREIEDDIEKNERFTLDE